MLPVTLKVVQALHGTRAAAHRPAETHELVVQIVSR
jgi:hypothetical protein